MKMLIIDKITENDKWEKLNNILKGECEKINNIEICGFEKDKKASCIVDDNKYDDCDIKKINICQFYEYYIKLGSKEVQISSFDYIIWHPGGKDTIEKYKELLQCNDGKIYNPEHPKIIFVSERAGDWKTVKEARCLLYKKIEELFKNSKNIEQLENFLNDIFVIQQKEISHEKLLYCNPDGEVYIDGQKGLLKDLESVCETINLLRVQKCE